MIARNRKAHYCPRRFPPSIPSLGPIPLPTPEFLRRLALGLSPLSPGCAAAPGGHSPFPGLTPAAGRSERKGPCPSVPANARPTRRTRRRARSSAPSHQRQNRPPARPRSSGRNPRSSHGRSPGRAQTPAPGEVLLPSSPPSVPPYRPRTQALTNPPPGGRIGDENPGDQPRHAGRQRARLPTAPSPSAATQTRASRNPIHLPRPRRRTGAVCSAEFPYGRARPGALPAWHPTWTPLYASNC